MLQLLLSWALLSIWDIKNQGKVYGLIIINNSTKVLPHTIITTCHHIGISVQLLLMSVIKKFENEFLKWQSLFPGTRLLNLVFGGFKRGISSSDLAHHSMFSYNFICSVTDAIVSHLMTTANHYHPNAKPISAPPTILKYRSHWGAAANAHPNSIIISWRSG